jgi:hypothetical protein
MMPEKAQNVTFSVDISKRALEGKRRKRREKREEKRRLEDSEVPQLNMWLKNGAGKLVSDPQTPLNEGCWAYGTY